MELDNTRITIRERGLLDTLDLSLHVLREFVQPVFWFTLAAVVPLGLLNYFLLGWMVYPQSGGDSQGFDYTEYRLYEWSPTDWGWRVYYMLPWRYLFDMALLIFIEDQLASIFVTAYLGEAVFMEKPTFRASLLIEGIPANPPYKARPRCHLHITDGNVEFCQDCEHEMAGKTVPMEPF